MNKEDNDFPKLQEHQVAIIMAQSSTGIILNEKLEVDISDGRDIYIVFENFENAKNYINDIKKSRTDIEFVIYDKGGLVLEFIK